MSEERNERVRNEIDRIEPQNGAKERMLENIKRKATLQEKEQPKSRMPIKRKIPSYQKFIKMALPIAACFVVAVIGVIKIMPLFNSTPIDPDVQISDPYAEINSAKEFEKLGIYINIPEDAEDIVYSIIDGNIADMSFSLEGHSFNLRASKQSEDFSGLFGERVASDKVDSATDATLETLKDGDSIYYKLLWMNGDIQYILTNSDGADSKLITSIYQETK